MKKLILKDNNPKEYIVVELDNGISFVHDNNSSKNFFSNKMIAEACGIDESNVRRYWKNFKDKRTNVLNSHVSLFVTNSDKPVDFKDFDFFNYVSNRVNTTEALQMQQYISEAINEKFNKDVGFTQPPNDYIDVFEWECEVEDLQDRRKSTSNLVSGLSKHSRLLEQNGDMEDLKIIQAAMSVLSNEFNQISLDISNATEVIRCFEKIRELSPKVTNSKYWGQNHLIPFKKS